MFAWAGAALFVLSLSYFVVSYVFRWGDLPVDVGSHVLRPDGGSHVRAIAANVLLFSFFALHHSLFARERIRTRVAALVKPGRERTVYVWIASLLFIAVCALWQPVPGVLWRVEGAGRVLLWALWLAGAWLTLRSAAVVGVRELAGLRAGEAAQAEMACGLSPSPGPPAKTRPAGEFTAAGPYAWVRHPIYTGWFLLVFAVATMTMTRLVFAVVSCAYLLLAIPFEERSLRAASGGAYERYAQRVRWKLFPGVY